jgi:hypothetical protein
MELSLACTVGREQLPSCFQSKIPTQCKPFAVVCCHGGVPSHLCATSLDIVSSYPLLITLKQCARTLYSLTRRDDFLMNSPHQYKKTDQHELNFALELSSFFLAKIKKGSSIAMIAP